MNVKNFIVGGIVGGIVDFLLGWVVYGMLLHDTFPMEPGAKENMMHIFLGCMSFGFLISWVFSQGEGISNVMSGVKMAAGISIFMSLCTTFFRNMTNETLDMGCGLICIDIIAGLVLAIGVGAAVAMVNGKMK